jgi:hypothetical protein
LLSTALSKSLLGRAYRDADDKLHDRWLKPRNLNAADKKTICIEQIPGE